MSLLSHYVKQLNLPSSTSFTKIVHNDAIVADAYHVETPGKPPAVLKICAKPRHYYAEITAYSLMNGKIPLPELIGTVPPTTDHQGGALLLSKVPGVLLSQTHLTDSLAFELGCILGKIHAVPMVGFGHLGNTSERYSCPMEAFKARFNTAISECSEHLAPSLIESAKRYMEAHLDLLAQEKSSCLTHKDFRPGNIIVNNGKIAGVIDWSTAHAGFPAEDFVGVYDGDWHFNGQLMSHSHTEQFMKGYQTVSEPPKFDSSLSLLTLCKSLRIISYLVKIDTWQQRDAKLYNRCKAFIISITG